MQLLVDRKTGRALGITLWETEEAVRATEEASRQRRAGVVGRGATAEATAEVYEVSFQAQAGQIRHSARPLRRARFSFPVGRHASTKTRHL